MRLAPAAEAGPAPRRGVKLAPVAAAAAAAGQGAATMAQDGWEALLIRANRGDGAAFAQFLREVSPVIRTILRARRRPAARSA